MLNIQGDAEIIRHLPELKFTLVYGVWKSV